jgi:hypothetical protein
VTEIIDFAKALRLLADNAEALSVRHDIAQMAALRRQVSEQSAKALRDSDLIDELRRQVTAMGRSLDAIGRLRKNLLTNPADAVQILVDALLMVDGPCSNYTGPASCRDYRHRTRGAKYAADAWCGHCVARDALERAGALPAGADAP